MQLIVLKFSNNTFANEDVTSEQHRFCEQSLSKSHQKASTRDSAEIVSSLLSRRSPSFWASHSGQTG